MSAATITKRADCLSTGEKIHIGKDVLVIVGIRYGENRCTVEAASVNELNTLSRASFNCSIEEEFKVDAPALSPAQQHAEELLGLVREMSTPYISPKVDTLIERCAALVAKIDPPVPPTLEEALAALDQTVTCIRDNAVVPVNGKSPYKNALEILDRARRAGVLKP